MRELLGGDVRNISCEFLFTDLSLAAIASVLLDDEVGEEVLRDTAFRDDNRVFVVIAVPGGKGDEDILS